MAGSSNPASGTSAVHSVREKRLPWPFWAAAGLIVALLIMYPPFHVTTKLRKSDVVGPKAFEASSFAKTFWETKLVPASTGLPDAATLLKGLRTDYKNAFKAHARQVGLGHVAYVFLRGTGRVTAIERNRVLLECGGEIVALRTGPVFGNIVRDGSGLIEVNDVPGLAEFNALSAELNRLVEEKVQPSLKNIALGSAVDFAGCAEVPETLAPAGPVMTFVPVTVDLSG